MANNAVGDISDAKAVFWYGIFSLSYSALFLFLYVSMNSSAWVSSYAAGWKGRVYLYLPVGFAWIMVSMFDNFLMREIFYGTAFLSVMGAFVQQWYALGVYLINAEGIYATLGFWLGFLLYFSLTVAEQIFQITMMPRIYRWSGEAGIFAKDHNLAFLAAIGWGVYDVFYIGNGGDAAAASTLNAVLDLLP